MAISRWACHQAFAAVLCQIDVFRTQKWKESLFNVDFMAPWKSIEWLLLLGKSHCRDFPEQRLFDRASYQGVGQIGGWRGV
jgi:hypothetical protein